MTKHFLSILGITLISSAMFGQVSVPQIISTTNVKDIYVRSNNRGFMYIDNSSHKMTSNSAGTIITIEPIAPIANNIGGIEEFLYGDTLSSIYPYYGNSTSISDGTNTFNTYTPVNAMAKDNDTTYTLGKYGSDYNILAINNGVQTLLASPNFTSWGLDSYSDMDYFEFNSNRYIAFVYIDVANSYLSLFDIDAKQYFQTIVSATSTTFTTTGSGKLFYSNENKIYELTGISQNANPLYKDVTSTIAYDIPLGQTINEFEFIVDGFSNDSIYIAASDGVYAESNRFKPIATSINDIEKAYNILIYPNPSNQYIQIENVKPNATYQVYNQLGKLVLNGKIDQQINIESLTNGIYFLSIEGYSVQKFIKQ